MEEFKQEFRESKSKCSDYILEEVARLVKVLPQEGEEAVGMGSVTLGQSHLLMTYLGRQCGAIQETIDRSEGPRTS